MFLFPDKESKISSLVELLILLTLKQEGKLRGVDIINKLSQQFQNWKPQSGTIYPILGKERLLKKGFVSLEGKYYQITEKGEEILKNGLKLFIETIIFIDNVFNYGRSFMDELNILKSEEKWLQNHIPHIINLIDTLPMVRPQLSEEKSSEIYIILNKLQELLQNTLQSIEKQITAIKDEEKIVRVKIK
ncbi:MAG: PadR family transcriptional regulator [Candidatus Helarchaeota archaeon]|nr:PadR family transcriptional regulator [Candidatus Helarchaeota archaeon]